MLVTPLPGADRSNLRAALREIVRDLTNLRGSSEPDRIAYLRWAGEAARKIHGQIREADVQRLVLTRWYELLFAHSLARDPALSNLVALEIDERVRALDAALSSLENRISQWSARGLFVVADTNVYLNADKLDELDIGGLIDAGNEAIHWLIPIVIIDELDKLKQHSNQHVRWRAGYTLGILDELLGKTGRYPAVLRSVVPPSRDHDTGRGPVTVEVLLDPPGHVRLPIADDEIIDRIGAATPLAARPIWLLTYDTGATMRAREAGVPVKKLVKSIGDEPVVSERASRRARRASQPTDVEPRPSE